jgi:hypothetical protein
MNQPGADAHYSLLKEYRLSDSSRILERLLILDDTDISSFKAELCQLYATHRESYLTSLALTHRAFEMAAMLSTSLVIDDPL